MPLPSELRRLERRPFVNREAALAVLRERWAAAQLGEGSVVLIGGEPGMGKTRLAARLAGEAYKDGAMLLYGRADQEAVRPYQPFAEALGHLCRTLRGLAAEPALSPPGRARGLRAGSARPVQATARRPPSASGTGSSTPSSSCSCGGGRRARPWCSRSTTSTGRTRPRC